VRAVVAFAAVSAEEDLPLPATPALARGWKKQLGIFQLQA